MGGKLQVIKSGILVFSNITCVPCGISSVFQRRWELGPCPAAHALCSAALVPCLPCLLLLPLHLLSSFGCSLCSLGSHWNWRQRPPSVTSTHVLCPALGADPVPSLRQPWGLCSGHSLLSLASAIAAALLDHSSLGFLCVLSLPVLCLLFQLIKAEGSVTFPSLHVKQG